MNPPLVKIPKAVIFDWDNTLVDTWPLIQVAIDTTMQKMGKEPWGMEKVKNDVHASMRESFPIIFGDKWQEAGEIYKKTYRSNHLEKLQLLPGAVEVINELFLRKILLAIISNKIGKTLRREVEYLGIANKFFSVIGSTDASYDKPRREPFDLALEGSDINSDRDLIWFIGDTITDIECAYNSGCQPILYGEGRNVPRNIIDKGKIDQEKPILCFENHYQILDYIKKYF